MDVDKKKLTLKAYRPWKPSILEDSINNQAKQTEQNSPLDKKKEHIKTKEDFENDILTKLNIKPLINENDIDNNNVTKDIEDGESIDTFTSNTIDPLQNLTTSFEEQLPTNNYLDDMQDHSDEKREKEKYLEDEEIQQDCIISEYAHAYPTTETTSATKTANSQAKLSITYNANDTNNTNKISTSVSTFESDNGSFVQNNLNEVLFGKYDNNSQFNHKTQYQHINSHKEQQPKFTHIANTQFADFYNQDNPDIIYQDNVESDLMPELKKLYLNLSNPKNLENQTDYLNDINNSLQTKSNHNDISNSISTELSNILSSEKNKGGLSVSINHNLSELTKNIQSIINSKKEESEFIKETLEKDDSSKLVIGGFFKPNINSPTTNSHGKKINYLINDLQKKEHEIEMLTNNLKTAEALEHAERADLARKKEEIRRRALEEKIKEIIIETQKASEQLQYALEQIKVTEFEHLQEEKLRIETENKLNESQYKNEELAKKIEELEEDYLISENNIRLLSKELEKLKAYNKDLSAIKIELCEDLRASERKNEKLQEDLKQSNLEVKNLCDKLQAGETKNENLQEELKQSNLEVKNLCNKLQASETKNENLLEELKQINLEVKNLYDKLRASEAKNKNLQEELKQTNLEVKNLCDKLRASERKNENSQEELKQTNLKVKNLQEKEVMLNNLTKQFEEISKELSLKIETHMLLSKKYEEKEELIIKLEAIGEQEQKLRMLNETKLAELEAKLAIKQKQIDQIKENFSKL